ncbi:hypothetical protein XELAEV_18000609mg [Xenopus laevis]|nr:hypothetical protein XELAEV_18000609mg [Xenopus laevis]
MERDKYLEEAYRQLSNTDRYEKTSKDPTSETIIHKHWEILQKDDEFGRLFKVIQYSFKRSPNLGDVLMKADLLKPNPTNIFCYMILPLAPLQGLFTCPSGKVVYVGKTKQEDWAINNCDTEKQKYVIPVSRHFRVQGHNSNQLRLLVLLVVYVPPRGGHYN